MIPFVFQDGSQAKTLTWQKIGSQADEWKQGLVQLSPSQSSYQVRKQSVSREHIIREHRSISVGHLVPPKIMAEPSDSQEYVCVRRLGNLTIGCFFPPLLSCYQIVKKQVSLIVQFMTAMLGF